MGEEGLGSCEQVTELEEKCIFETEESNVVTNFKSID